jgi:hypothetical protein
MILTRESAGQRIHRRTVLEYALESQSQSASVTSPAISLRSVGGSWAGKRCYICMLIFTGIGKIHLLPLCFLLIHLSSRCYDEL